MMEELQLKRLHELALRAYHAGLTQFTRFLEPSMEQPVRAAAAQAGVRAEFYGGYADAERCVAAFYPDDPPCARQGDASEGDRRYHLLQ